ncbi:MAG: hypothetical protein AMK75_01620 [Planctomycetes bacterium SM23_65]|nr:MAG: hypothetical protein AMK75_01620 [Planctomycetes bacterium SM23_65]
MRRHSEASRAAFLPNAGRRSPWKRRMSCALWDSPPRAGAASRPWPTMRRRSGWCRIVGRRSG